MKLKKKEKEKERKDDHVQQFLAKQFNSAL